MRRRCWLLVAAVAVLAGCSDSGDETTVFAAASLTDVFTDMAEAFDGEVTFNFAGSQQLVAQIGQGAEADVVATADERTMRELEVDVEARELARNRLVIVVEPGNPLGITGLEGLGRPDVAVVVAGGAPAGRYAIAMLDRANVHVEPRSYEKSVRDVVARVALGEADAGIAYVTDAIAADGDVEAVEIPSPPNAETAYPIAALTDEGKAFVDFALSPAGQAILADHGFLVP